MSNRLFKDTKEFTFLSIMFGITIFFTYTAGMIPAGMASVAILCFIPTVITSLIYGPVKGAFMGALAGLVSLSKAILMPAGILDPYFINPLVSVLPRIFIGVVPYYIYKLTKSIVKASSIASFLSGALGAITNTALVMPMLYFLYGTEIAKTVGSSFKVLLIGIISSSMFIEAAVMGIFTLAVMAVYIKKNPNIKAEQ
ncbi:ECF transporter S component [Anaerofustis stercorihominis]|uniref:ECF transporter S component n=1 Tax=Anaerofustis stercorihominis TaxID=214853 RepID=A0A3E3E2K4_9FIRM|nr:ECF transporter S component [Anaerofustis stercorihominis]RGD75812.1 ECF transporter S component [Anaerofustis stercorihominis]